MNFLVKKFWGPKIRGAPPEIRGGGGASAPPHSYATAIGLGKPGVMYFSKIMLCFDV